MLQTTILFYYYLPALCKKQLSLNILDRIIWSFFMPKSTQLDFIMGLLVEISSSPSLFLYQFQVSWHVLKVLLTHILRYIIPSSLGKTWHFWTTLASSISFFETKNDKGIRLTWHLLHCSWFILVYLPRYKLFVFLYFVYLSFPFVVFWNLNFEWWGWQRKKTANGVIVW